MKNKSVNVNTGGISRRKLLKAGGAAVVLTGVGPLANRVAYATSSPQTNATDKSQTNATAKPQADAREEDTLCRVLAFWVAATNAHPNLAQLSADTVKNVTGLTFSRGNGVDKALQRIANNSATYDNIKKEFLEFTNLFAYAPGQCPKNPATLKKLADVDPNG